MTAVTNDNPMVVTTSAAHQLYAWDAVRISGVQGNKAANGDFIAIWQSATTFALYSMPEGTGDYTKGGKVKFADLKIAGATNDTPPIVVTTTTPHRLSSGMQVKISGVQGNTAANRTFTITKVNDTSFKLNDAHGNSNYTGGGVVEVIAEYDIKDASNASPIKVITKTPHQILLGTQITISGVEGNTAANGTFIALTYSHDNHTLVLVKPKSGDGAYTSGGSAVVLKHWDFFGDFRSIPSNLASRDKLDSNIVSLVFASAKMLYVGTKKGGVYRFYEKSTNTWIKQRLDNIASGRIPDSHSVPVTSIAVDSSDVTGQSIYITFGGTGN